MNKRDRYHYLQGKIDESWNLAVRKNGEYIVGCMESPHKIHIEEYQIEQENLLRQMGITKEELLNDIKD